MYKERVGIYPSHLDHGVEKNHRLGGKMARIIYLIEIKCRIFAMSKVERKKSLTKFYLEERLYGGLQHTSI